MKHLLILGIAILGLNMAYAQNETSNIEKEVILEKIDKSSSLAFIYQNGVLVEKGLLLNGKREGVWQSFNENGTLATEASFSKGQKNGLWNIYEGTDLKYVLHYQNDSRLKANNLAIAE